MNELTISQISSVLNEVISQATGKTIAPVDTSQLVAVAQTQLMTSADPLINAVSQVLSKTIFSVRPYTEKFRELERTEQAFGNMVRKLQVCDDTFVDDDRVSLADGESVDMYKVRKPTIIQTNFYGQTVYEDYWTTFKDQLDTAFSSADEFGRFVSMILQNKVDRRAQAREELSRATIANLIAGTISSEDNHPERVVHLITEYNAVTGSELTSANYQDAANYPEFIRWVYSRVMEISSLMEERSTLFHSTFSGKTLTRHTPKEMQKMYLLAPYKYSIQARVLADVFNPKELNGLNGTIVTYWQSIADNKRDAIDVTPSVMTSTGAVEKAENVKKSGIFGVIFDHEAAGTTHVNEWSSTTPFNSRGGYWNTFFHATDRYINDFTENSVVLLLD